MVRDVGLYGDTYASACQVEGGAGDRIGRGCMDETHRGVYNQQL